MTQPMNEIFDGVDQPAVPTVSAVIVSYFTGPLLARSIASLSEQPEIQEIILVDNGNLPGDVDRAVECVGATPVRLKSGHGNIGFAAACNRGAEIAAGENLLFFNPDAVMPKGGVAQLLADSRAWRGHWLLAPRLVGPDGAEQQGSRRATLTPWRAFVETTRLYRLAPRHPYFQRFNLHKQECPDDVCEAPTISGACFMLPRDAYWDTGGMDEQYFLHVEDIDFCLRYRKSGGKIYFTPHVSVTHFKSSSRANPVKIEARKTASVIRYFKTHFSDVYPAPFLWLVAAALWMSFALLFVKRAIGRALRLFGVRVRTGKHAAKRARSIFSGRSSR